MRNFWPVLVLIFITASCDNEIDIITEPEDLTVLYGLLDASADTNYIRVQRGYLSEDPASVSFDRSDSLYYDTNAIDVVIRQYDRLTSETPENERLLVYDNNVALKPGTFTTQGHYLYRVPQDYELNRTKFYEVAVLKEDGSESAARTGLVGDLQIRVPRETNAFRLFNGVVEFAIPPRGEASGTAGVNAYQVLIHFNYRELDRTTLDSTYKTATIQPPVIETQNNEVSLRFPSNEFFNSIANQIEEDPNILRFFLNIEIEVWAAAEELVTYYQLNEPSTGINQNRPTFEQVTNGTGIISSRTRTSRDNIQLEPNRFFPDLISSSATCGLNFVNFKGVDRDTCFCRDGQEFCL